VDSDVLKRKLIRSSRRRHRMGQVLFVAMVILAAGLVAFNIWVYIINP
jgi:hypothetical protein